MILRLGLLFSAAGWGVSFFFAFAPWPVAEAQLQTMGALPIEHQPLLDYWLRMAAIAFGCIGIASALACARPHSFEQVVRLLGPFHGIMGITLIVASSRNHLVVHQHPTFVPDIMFCLLTAALIQAPLFQAQRMQRAGRDGH